MTLNDQMEFDHVIRVDDVGQVYDTEVYAPSLIDGELDTAEWELLDGYSGQDHYSGPVMHDSEFIGGRMEHDILARPGLYVAIPAYYLDDEDPNGYPIAEGWGVAYRAQS